MTKSHEINPVPQVSILDRLQTARTFLFRVPWTIVCTLSRRWWPFSNYKPPPLKEHISRHLMTWYAPRLSVSKSKITESA